MSHIACLDNDCNNKNRSRKISFLFIRSWPPPSKIQYSSYGREGAQPRGEENNHHHVYWVNDPNDSIT